mmetsp:Transcript_1968/g.2990  ORF Transcript_1968/g.2990 Transcript_1968/m.2990 type:complete len:245 (-) Transcript_1968:797-1531(-)
MSTMKGDPSSSRRSSFIVTPPPPSKTHRDPSVLIVKLQSLATTFVLFGRIAVTEGKGKLKRLDLLSSFVLFAYVRGDIEERAPSPPGRMTDFKKIRLFMSPTSKRISESPENILIALNNATVCKSSRCTFTLSPTEIFPMPSYAVRSGSRVSSPIPKSQLTDITLQSEVSISSLSMEISISPVADDKVVCVSAPSRSSSVADKMGMTDSLLNELVMAFPVTSNPILNPENLSPWNLFAVAEYRK